MKKRENTKKKHEIDYLYINDFTYKIVKIHFHYLGIEIITKDDVIREVYY
jgi:hypothetical protein